MVLSMLYDTLTCAPERQFCNGGLNMRPQPFPHTNGIHIALTLPIDGARSRSAGLMQNPAMSALK